jgi:predicted secreted hydrolase
MNAKALILWLMLAAPLWAQGFAGLGGEAEGFAIPSRGTVLSFPADHGPHPDFRIEWWYLTANLRGEDGRDYGVQWTLFRSALAPAEAEGWQSPQLWMGHAALTTPERHFVAERMARGGVGQAGVLPAPFEAWIDEWRMAGPDVSALTLSANGGDFGYDLSLSADGPLILQGERGYSVKSAGGQASHYYSQPFYRVTGRLHLPQGEVPVTGQGWLDREWSSQPLEETQQGWDWISIHFEDGAKLMGFQLRQGDGATYTSGSWIGADGRAEPFGDGVLRLTPVETAEVAGRALPVVWRVELPGRGLDVTVEALNRRAWMDTLFPYWEGPVRVSGSHPGRGYLEMTGY